MLNIMAFLRLSKSSKPIDNTLKNSYDSSWDFLHDRFRRPHSYPNPHTLNEIKLIRDMGHRNPNPSFVVFWVKLIQQGYKRLLFSKKTRVNP